MSNILSRLGALLCALCMLTTMAAPALADPAGNPVEVEIDTYMVTPAPTADPHATSAPAVPDTTFIPAATEIPLPTYAPAVTHAPSATQRPAPEQPFVFPQQLQILTDRQQMWLGDEITYTIIGLSPDSVLAVYDPRANMDLDPLAPTILMARTPGYPDPDPMNPIPEMTWNDALQGWQFAYTPALTGQFQLVWRLYSGADGLMYQDYTELNRQDVITVEALPTVQIFSMEPSGSVGAPITIVADTTGDVNYLTLVDENGAQLPYIESVTSEDMGTHTRWTCVFRFYEPGSKRVSVLATAALGYVQKTITTPVYTVGVIPSATAVPPPATTTIPMATSAPGVGAYTAGYVRFKQVPSAEAKVGESITLNLNIEFAGYDGSRINYTEEDFYKYVDYIEIQPEVSADPYPFVVDESLQRIIIHSYEEMLESPFRFNVRLKNSLSNGTYTFNFTLRYRLRGNEEPEADTTEAGMVFVTGAKTPSSGGGGGGMALPNTQAKLLVDSLTTDPANPRAGDTFDVVLTLKNTNEKQYVQNIKLSYTADNDVLLPANGSSSFYIEKIGAGETYELRIPVTARADMPDAPVKMNVAMEYEDKSVSSLSASQVVVLNVKQVQNMRLDELVLPQYGVTVGDSASFSMNVINAGRTTLYNVSAAMVENELFMTAGSAYVGNMEPGTSKTIELDIYPMAEGPIDGALRVTYEDANGNPESVDTPFSIYASPMEEGFYEPYEPIIEPTPAPVFELSDVLGRLPPWVYGAAGLLTIFIVMLLAIAVHRHRAAADMDFDDD